MKTVEIVYISGTKVFSSFNIKGLSEIYADTDNVYMYFTSLNVTGSLTNNKEYYGTYFKFNKTGYGQQLLDNIILTISPIFTNQNLGNVTLDLTTDTSITITQASIQD